MEFMFNTLSVLIMGMKQPLMGRIWATLIDLTTKFPQEELEKAIEIFEHESSFGCFSDPTHYIQTSDRNDKALQQVRALKEMLYPNGKGK